MITIASPRIVREQPVCDLHAETYLVDCRNWEVNAVWDIPQDAVSGVYFARLVRQDDLTKTWRMDGSRIIASTKFANPEWDQTLAPPCRDGGGTCAEMDHAYGAQRRESAVTSAHGAHSARGSGGCTAGRRVLRGHPR